MSIEASGIPSPKPDSVVATDPQTDTPQKYEWYGRPLRFGRDHLTLLQSIGIRGFEIEGTAEGQYQGSFQDAQLHLWVCLADDADIDKAFLNPKQAKLHVLRKWAPSEIDSPAKQGMAVALMHKMWGDYYATKTETVDSGKEGEETPGKSQDGSSTSPSSPESSQD